MDFKLSRRSLVRLNGVNSILIAIAVDAVRKSPFDFGIADMGGLRTAVEQHRLYLDGKSKLDGYVNQSKHQKGLAFDIVCYKENKITWDEDVFRAVAAHIRKVAKEQYNHELTWGGDWMKFVDMPHFELKNG